MTSSCLVSNLSCGVNTTRDAVKLSAARDASSYVGSGRTLNGLQHNAHCAHTVSNSCAKLSRMQCTEYVCEKRKHLSWGQMCGPKPHIRGQSRVGRSSFWQLDFAGIEDELRSSRLSMGVRVKHCRAVEKVEAQASNLGHLIFLTRNGSGLWLSSTCSG